MCPQHNAKTKWTCIYGLVIFNFAEQTHEHG